MEKIKVLFTGGTIGSLADGNNINTNDSSKFMLLNKYGKNIERFEIESPLSILSENLNYENWLDMIAAIHKALQEDNKGIIVTHGSDTLAYSSALLGLIFHKAKKPIVLVASNKILTEKDANGVDNFAGAVTLIDSYKKGGVFVSYKNTNEAHTNIHLGVRMMEPAHFSDNFTSAEGKTFAEVKGDKIEYLYSYVPTCKTKWNYQFNFSKTGVLIRPFAGLDYRVYMSNKAKPDFVLHDLYHSGTANTKSLTKLDYCTNLLEFANYCKNNNIDLYLSNIKQKDVNYDSTNQLLQHHITPLYDSLTNVALAKLTIAYNFLNKTQRKQFLEENVAGEILTGLESEQELTV